MSTLRPMSASGAYANSSSARRFARRMTPVASTTTVASGIAVKSVFSISPHA